MRQLTASVRACHGLPGGVRGGTTARSAIRRLPPPPGGPGRRRRMGACQTDERTMSAVARWPGPGVWRWRTGRRHPAGVDSVCCGLRPPAEDVLPDIDPCEEAHHGCRCGRRRHPPKGAARSRAACATPMPKLMGEALPSSGSVAYSSLSWHGRAPRSRCALRWSIACGAASCSGGQRLGSVRMPQRASRAPVRTDRSWAGPPFRSLLRAPGHGCRGL
jgi:hypothetical protein